MYTPPPFPRTTGLADPEEALLLVLEEYEADQFRLKVGGTISSASVSPSTLTDFSVTSSGTAAKIISAATPCSSVNVQSDPTNTTNVLVGTATGQHTLLLPGDSCQITIDDASKVYSKAVSGSPVLNCLAS